MRFLSVSTTTRFMHCAMQWMKSLVSNFITTVLWQKVYSPKNSARRSLNHDYGVYATEVEVWRPNLVLGREQDSAYINRDNDPGAGRPAIFPGVIPTARGFTRLHARLAESSLGHPKVVDRTAPSKEVRIG